MHKNNYESYIDDTCSFHLTSLHTTDQTYRIHMIISNNYSVIIYFNIL